MFNAMRIGLFLLISLCICYGDSRAEAPRADAPAKDPLKATIQMPAMDKEAPEVLREIVRLAPAPVNLELVRPPANVNKESPAHIVIPAGTCELGKLLEEIKKKTPGMAWEVIGGTIVMIYKADPNATNVMETKIKTEMTRHYSGTLVDLIGQLFANSHEVRLGMQYMNFGEPDPRGEKTFELDIVDGATISAILSQATEKTGIRWIAHVPDRPREFAFYVKNAEGKPEKLPMSSSGYMIKFQFNLPRDPAKQDGLPPNRPASVTPAKAPQ